jgi:hypothetical protein
MLNQGQRVGFRTPRNTIIAFVSLTLGRSLRAPTASGKTEAAFLPICSRLMDAPKGGVQVLYISEARGSSGPPPIPAAWVLAHLRWLLRAVRR